MNNMIHGRATIFLDGSKIISEDGASLKIGGVVNDTVMVGGKSFNKQKVVASEVKCKVPVTADTNITDLQSMADIEVQFASDTGKRFVIASAAQTNEIEFGEDGLIELMLSGDPAKES